MVYVSFLNTPYHPTTFINLLDIFDSFFLYLIRKSFYAVRPCKRVYCITRTTLIGNDLLRAKGNSCSLFRWKGKSLVKGICMERLRSAKNRSESLNGYPHNIISGLLRSKRNTGGLGMKPEHTGSIVLCTKSLFHNPRPEPSGRAEFCHLFKKVVMDGKEERHPFRDFFNIKPPCLRMLKVLNRIGKRKSHLLNRCGACLTHVIAAYAYRIPLRNPVTAILHDVYRDFYGILWGEYISSPRYKLL